MTQKRSRAVGSLPLTSKRSSPKRCKLDRISQLPEPLLHHIMLFLTMKDDAITSRLPSKTWNAVTTRSLSKAWNAAWNSFPVLEFDQREFENSKSSAKKKIEDFCNYIQKSITRHQSDISLQKFKIMIDLTNAGRFAVKVQDIIRWLNYAKTKKVRSLSFHCRKNHSYKDEWRYELPESLFCSKSLNELDLFGCKFLEDEIRTTNIGLCLRKLRLVHVRVHQLSLQSFLSSCCSVEEVCIQNCNGFETVKLAGVKLDRVEIVLARRQLQTITIEAPRLQYLCCGGEWDNIKMSILGSDCKNLKELKICDSGTQSDVDQIISLKLPLIENVVLRRCYRQETSEMITSDVHQQPGQLMPRKFNMLFEDY